jgi:hypothetical protein
MLDKPLDTKAAENAPETQETASVSNTGELQLPSVAEQAPQEAGIAEAASWEDAKRDDLKHLNVMVAQGWTPEFSADDLRAGRVVPGNWPTDAVNYSKDTKLARKTIDFATHAQKWVVIDDQGVNHARHYTELVEVMEAE